MNIEEVAKQAAAIQGDQKAKKAGYDDIEISDSKSGDNDAGKQPRKKKSKAVNKKTESVQVTEKTIDGPSLTKSPVPKKGGSQQNTPVTPQQLSSPNVEKNNNSDDREPLQQQQQQPQQSALNRDTASTDPKTKKVEKSRVSTAKRQTQSSAAVTGKEGKKKGCCSIL